MNCDIIIWCSLIIPHAIYELFLLLMLLFLSKYRQNICKPLQLFTVTSKTFPLCFLLGT